MLEDTLANTWADVVVAILSVNLYPVERTFEHLDGFVREGLVDPTNLATWSVAETTHRLRLAGYDRGRLTPMMAERLVSLGRFVQEGGREHCDAVLLRGEADEISALLSPVRGVGPAVLRTFLMLRGVSETGADSEK